MLDQSTPSESLYNVVVDWISVEARCLAHVTLSITFETTTFHRQETPRSLLKYHRTNSAKRITKLLPS